MVVAIIAAADEDGAEAEGGAEGRVGRESARGRIRTRRAGGTIIGRGGMIRRWLGLVCRLHRTSG